ncbi:CheR family methyltransferase [Shewanella sp.]|uniref:CheR family methyltransferase n=1 Tax=Shewanella sp. TaxID=50422 RepID=UPI003D0B178D
MGVKRNMAESLWPESFQQIPLHEAEFQLICQWLYQAAGIRLAPNKKALVASRLNGRLRELEFTSFRRYYELISSNQDAQAPSERQRAIDLLTTNETFFFREDSHFSFIRESVLPLFRGQHLKCWSAASSTGEEAYTLAMVLASHHQGSWQIIGTDINAEVIEKAKKGVYPMQRAENIPKPYLHQYCLKGTGEKSLQFKVSRELRSQVEFRHANLQQLPERLGSFDLVLLRNVMIYFDQFSKQRVVSNIIQHMNVGGFLLIGHAESLTGVTDQVNLLQPSVYRLGRKS